MLSIFLITSNFLNTFHRSQSDLTYASKVAFQNRMRDVSQFITSFMSLKLSLRVVEAAELSHATSEDETFPYCLIQVSNTSQIQRTAVCEKTITPFWDQEFSFMVRHKMDSLKIFVKDCSRVKTHNVLSKIALRLNEYRSGTVIDDWFSLTPVRGVKNGGKIHLKFRLEPINRVRLPRLSPYKSTGELMTLQSQEPELTPLAIPEPIHPPEPVPASARAPSRVKPTPVVLISAEFGDIIDTEDPNSVASEHNPFAEISESPAKMYSADAMTTLMLEMSKPVLGPYWAMARIASFICHQACDYFTNFAVVGCDKASRDFTIAMRTFFDMSNHDINRNRIKYSNDPEIGPLVSSVFKAYDTTIAALARKATLIQAKHAINAVMKLVHEISIHPLLQDDYQKAVNALTLACGSYQQREDGVFYRNLGGAPLESLGVQAAIVAFGLSSLEHAMNCYICNSFGTRIILERIIRPMTAGDAKIIIPSVNIRQSRPLVAVC